MYGHQNTDHYHANMPRDFSFDMDRPGPSTVASVGITIHTVPMTGYSRIRTTVAPTLAHYGREAVTQFFPLFDNEDDWKMILVFRHPCLGCCGEDVVKSK